MLKIFMLIVGLIVAIVAGFRFYIVPEAIKKDWSIVDFKTIKVPSSPNYYLVCPKGFCPSSSNYTQSPIFDFPVSKLQMSFDAVINKQERIKLLAVKEGGLKRVYVQTSALWSFPDFINVEFVAITGGRSSIAIFSQSRFGYSDLGVNKARVIDWLSQL